MQRMALSMGDVESWSNRTGNVVLLCDRQAGTGDTGVGVSSSLIASLLWMGGNRMSKDRMGEEKDVNIELEEWKSRGEGST